MQDRSDRAPRRWWVVVTMLLALATVTSSGCWKQQTPQQKAKAEAEKLKKKTPERPFDVLRVFTEPNDKSSFDPNRKEDQRIATAIKPGHWTGVLVQAKSNLQDFGGRLTSIPCADGVGNRLELERSPFFLETTRGAALPKGQQKVLETLFYAPRVPPEIERRSTWIQNRLTNSRGARELESSELLQHMPSFQYYMLVLARESRRYSHLKVLDCVRPPTQYTPTNVEDTCYYRVVFPSLAGPLALSNESLAWTSTAAIVWDDVLPKALTPEQQRALVDWLHWGGQLIVSGPDSLDKLKGSFLESYLPAMAGTAGPVEPAALSELGEFWSISGDRSKRPGANLAAPWSGIELVVQPQGAFLPGTGQLVAERRVGRGRVAVTAFRLSEPDLISWRSYDSFFHNALLRRPPRVYDEKINEFDYAGENPPDRYDADLVTNVRYFTRDARDPNQKPFEKPKPPEEEQLVDSFGNPIFPDVSFDPNPIDKYKGESGAAGWSDFGWISSSARHTLRDAAGISVPRRDFVLKMIGLYLLVIVPINWLVFRLAGRVEWAWLAVPAIALVWGVLVVWLAQLDIGFARAETEVAVLELQGNYPRGHLTRYSALYSSLSTSYDVELANDAGQSSIAQPLASDQVRLSGQGASTVSLALGTDHTLNGFPVMSNSTGMVHSEQMVDVAGGVHWQTSDDGSATLTNRTKLPLAGAVVLRQREENGKAAPEAAWIGALPPGETVKLTFEPFDADDLQIARKDEPLAAHDPADGGLSLRRLLDCAEDTRALLPGEVRLVAWYEGGLPGIAVSPSSSQARRATVVVAHLDTPLGAAPRPDENLRTVSRASENANQGQP